MTCRTQINQARAHQAEVKVVELAKVRDPKAEEGEGVEVKFDDAPPFRGPWNLRPK